MKQIVADAAVKEVENGMILGLGSGSTAALMIKSLAEQIRSCLLYTSPSPRDRQKSRMPSSA